MRPIVRLLFACLALLLAAPATAAESVAQNASVRTLQLPDASGKPRSLAEFRGKAVLLFFGYTHCPDVCPTELHRLAEVMRRLGPDADRLQVLFVTLDPERDSAAMLQSYVQAFDKRFLALRGDAAATEAATREFDVVYQRIKGRAPGRYSIDHSAYTYAIDPQGRLQQRFTPEQPAAQLADAVRPWLAAR